MSARPFPFSKRSSIGLLHGNFNTTLIEQEAVFGAEKVADKGKEMVLRQALEDIVFAPTVAKKQLIKWKAPVMSRNAPSAGRT